MRVRIPVKGAPTKVRRWLLLLAVVASAALVSETAIAATSTKTVTASRSGTRFGQCVFTYSVQARPGYDLVSVTSVKAVNVSKSAGAVRCWLGQDDSLGSPTYFDKTANLAAGRSYTWKTNVTKMDESIRAHSYFIYKSDPYYASGAAWIG